MSHTPTYDAKIKAILDVTQPGERTCEITGQKWIMTEEEIDWYRKFNVPPSKRAPLVRMWHMTCFWLSFQWWWNKHPETGKPILSFVHPASGIKVLPDKEWYAKDFSSEGREVDFGRSFFEQLRELQLCVPYLASRNAKEPENSISQFSFGDVNSYFVMFCRSRDSLFGDYSFDVEDSAELVNVGSVSNSYNIANSRRIHGCKFVRESFDCIRSCFLFDCRNCENCFGATNKRNAKYLWFNEQLSKEEWERRFSEVDFRRRSAVEGWFGKFDALLLKDTVWPENFNDKIQDSTGEYLSGVTRVQHGFLCAEGPHDCAWVAGAWAETFDCFTCAGAFSCNTCYLLANSDRCVNAKFCDKCIDCQNVEYCLQCINCENCFGCVGLNRKRFCILNRQYTEEEYWKTVDCLKIAMLEQGTYGEFIPASMAHDTYQLGGAELYYGALPGFGKQIGGNDFEPESAGAVGDVLSDVQKLHDVSQIPDCIDDFTDDRWKGVGFYDPVQKRRFAFTAPEIAFYRRHGIGPSRQHFIARMWDMYRSANTGRLDERSCDKCASPILVAYNAKYPERTVYCKPCYLRFLEEKG